MKKDGLNAKKGKDMDCKGCMTTFLEEYLNKFNYEILWEDVGVLFNKIIIK